MNFARRPAVLALLGFAGFLATAPVRSDSQPLPSPAPTPVQVRIVTTFSFVRLVKRIAGDYATSNPGAPPVTVREQTYGEALRAVEGGDADIAILDRAPDSTTDADRPIAIVPFAVVAHSDANVTSLSKAQVTKIFAGSIENWNAVGGANLGILPVVRVPSSGTTKLFAAQFGVPSPTMELVDNTSSAVLQAVAALRGRVGYVGLPYAPIPAGVRVLAVEGALPSAETIATGRYTFYASLHAVTAGVATVTVSRFLSFFETRRDALHESGYYSVFEARRR